MLCPQRVPTGLVNVILAASLTDDAIAEEIVRVVVVLVAFIEVVLGVIVTVVAIILLHLV